MITARPKCSSRGSARLRGTCEAADRGSRGNFRRDFGQTVRYPNITIIEENEASQFGIGVVSARIAEMVLHDGRAVIPIGSFIPRFGVTLAKRDRT